MTVLILDKYLLTSDAYGYTVSSISIDKDGELKKDNRGNIMKTYKTYTSNLLGVIRILKERSYKDIGNENSEDIMTINQLLKEVEKIDHEIESIILLYKKQIIELKAKIVD